MGFPRNAEALIERLPAFSVPVWEDALAHWVSQVGCPPLLSLAGLLLFAETLAKTGVWGWVVLYSMPAILAPSLYVLWLVHLGKLSDLHLSVREERFRPLLVALAGSAAGWGCLRAGNTPPLLTLIAGVQGVQLLLFTVLTRRWKVSLHGSSAAGLAVLGWVMFGNAFLPFLIGVPLIGWSRVHLRCHTVGQVVVGAVLGGSVMAAAFMFERWRWTV